MASLGMPQPTINPALFGWAGSNINQPPPPTPGTSTSPTGPTSPIQLPSNFGSTNTNPYGQGTRGGGDLGFNLAQTNLQTGLQRNQLSPILAQLMLGYGQNAGNTFSQFANAGSPFYQAEQAGIFGQGTQQNQNAAALARQQLAAQGYGATPSGATAAMIGGQNVAGSQNLVNAFLQMLFNNQQLQLQGAQGLSGLANLFNPSQLLTSNTNPGIQQPTNTGAETMTGVSNLLKSLFG